MNARGQYIAFRAILVKEVLRFTRIWVQTVLPPMITTALYFVIFGQLIGSQIGDVHGFHYMQYIVPGLILMSVITNSTPMWCRLSTAPNFSTTSKKC